MAVTLRPYQLAAVDAVEAHDPSRGALLVMATGCHVRGQGILMFDGSVKLVEDVVVGDLLMGPGSTARTVISLCRGVDDIVEIRPKKGEPWRVNRGHVLSLVRTQRSRTSNQPSRKGGVVVDVRACDWLGWSKTKKHMHKLFRVGVEFPVGMALPLDPYLLGLILGDGGISHGSVVVTSDDHEIVSHLESVAASYGMRISVSAYDGRTPSYAIVGPGGAGSNPIIEHLRSLGLFGLLSGEKFVPHQYKIASKSDRLRLLAGMIDSDGHLDRSGGFDWISKSKAMAEDFAFVARSCGFWASLRDCVKTSQFGHSGTYWRVQVSGHIDSVPTLVERKKAAPRRQRKDPLRCGFEVVPCGYRDQYYGFSLDEDQRYVLDDFTVTHNTGKTRTAAEIVRRHDGRVVWLTNQIALGEQAAEVLGAGIVQASRDECSGRVTCASIQTLRIPGRVERILDHGPVTLVVADESHHSSSDTYSGAIDAFPGARVVGLTATPKDEDLDRWDIVYHYSIVDALRDGYLVEPYAYVEKIKGLDLQRVASSGDDYNLPELSAELIRAGVVRATVAVLEKTVLARRLPTRDDSRYLSASGRPTLVYTASVEQARLTAEPIPGAEWVSAKSKGRADTLDRFRAGKIPVLCSVDVLREGVDLPCASAILIARPTRSHTVYVQMVGRGLRLFQGKRDCLILDLVGATKDHSIVSAPILLGGTRCRKSANGAHVFEGARCACCGFTVPCPELLGPHDFHDAPDGTRCCSACGQLQCPGANSGRHTWLPIAGTRVACIDCGAEHTDPIAYMIDRKAPPKADATWLRLPVEPETWACDVGEHGILYVRRDGELFSPIWLRYRARKPDPLTSSPIDRSLVRLYADDLIRRARRISERDAPPSKGQHSYASRLGFALKSTTVGGAQREISRAKATKRAVATGIAKGVR